MSQQASEGDAPSTSNTRFEDTNIVLPGGTIGMVGGGLNFNRLLASSFDDQPLGVASFLLGREGRVLAMAEDGELQATDLSQVDEGGGVLDAAVEDPEALAEMLASARESGGEVEIQREQSSHCYKYHQIKINHETIFRHLFYYSCGPRFSQ